MEDLNEQSNTQTNNNPCRDLCSQIDVSTLPCYGSYFEPARFKKSDVGAVKLNKILISEVSSLHMISSNFLMHRI
jgi:hypothetical protein